MVSHQQAGMLMLAWVILAFNMQPADLETAALQLAEFDAINDAKTDRK